MNECQNILRYKKKYSIFFVFMSKAYFFGYNKPNHKTKIKTILYAHKFGMLGQSFGHQKGVV